MSRQIQTHDVVAENRRLDLGILNRRGAYSKAVTVSLILTEGLIIKKFEQTHPLIPISIFKIRRDIEHFGHVSGSTSYIF